MIVLIPVPCCLSYFQMVETSKHLRIFDDALVSTVVLVHLALATGIKVFLDNLSLREL